jgi:hypothetical protein
VPKRIPVKARLLELLATRAPALVTEPLRDELATALPDVSAAALRHALIDSGYPLDPLVEGVRQDSFEHLRRSLEALANLYERETPARRRMVRELVITARTHAGFALRSSKTSGEVRVEKQEMDLWMKTWLENPPLFAAWAELRAPLIPPRE